MTVHQCQFPQLSKLHILFTKPEASGETAIWEKEMGSEDKAGEYLNWNIYSDLSNYSIHNCPLNILLQLGREACYVQFLVAASFYFLLLQLITSNMS